MLVKNNNAFLSFFYCLNFRIEAKKCDPSFNIADVLPSSKSVSNYVKEISEIAKHYHLPSIIEKLLNGKGAITFDLACSKKEIAAITAHTIDSEWFFKRVKFIDFALIFRNLSSNVIELICWDTSKARTKNEMKQFLSNSFEKLGLPTNYMQNLYLVTDEGANVKNLTDKSISCAAHVLNTVTKHIIKSYKYSTSTPELNEFAIKCSNVIEAVKSFNAGAR